MITSKYTNKTTRVRLYQWILYSFLLIGLSLPIITNASPLVASLISPKENITETSPFYKWNAVKNASWYYLWVNDSKGNKIKKWYTSDQAGCASGVGTCSISSSIALNKGKGKWWVRTWNSSGYGSWSTALTFSIGSSPQTTSLLTPQGKITNTTPFYKWNAVKNASWYYLWVNDSKGNRIKKWYTATEVGCNSGGGICSIKSSIELREGKGKWWVQTWNHSGYGQWSTPIEITVTSILNTPPSIIGSAKTSTTVYSNYQFLPTAEDADNDELTFSIANKPAWATFDTTTGLLQGIPSATGTHSNIIISVSDSSETTPLPSFTIEILAAIEIARAYGAATQGGSPSYHYYSAPNLVIDADDATFNHTEGSSTHNWWQVALPKNTLIQNIMIKGRDGSTHRLVDAKVYLLSEPYTGSLDESKRVATLLGTAAAQPFSFSTAKEASYLLVKAAANNHLHLATVEVYGTIPKEPAFNQHEKTYLISGATSNGTVITAVSATDYQNDTLSYSIVGDAPFTVDAQGKVTVSGALSASSYTFDIQVSDGINTTLTTLTVNVTSTNVIEEVLASGDVLNTPVTEAELIQATLDEIEASKTLLLAAKTQIFNLNTDGTAKADSLNNITWNPSHDASLFVSTLGKNTPLLYTNAVAQSGYTIYKKEIGIIGEKDNARYLVLGANPLRVTGNEAMNQVMENSLAWLSGRDDLKTAPFKAVIAHLDESYWFKDESKTREWLDTHYAGQIAYNTENSCDGAALAACLASKPDVLIISQVSAANDDANAIAATVNQALKDGISILYIHHDGDHKALGKALFDTVFDVTYIWDNYWKKLSLDSYNPTADLNVLSDDLNSIKTLFTHLKHNDFSFNWGTCVDSKGVQGENNDNCTNVTGLSTEFQKGASVVKSMLDSFDNRKKNIFLEEGYRLQKLLALTADKLRQKINYPMDKVTSDDSDFMRSYYADHAVYNYRAINPVQTDMGNFSRSDFLHITPTTRAVSLTSKKSFRSTGAYALPGQTVTATRTDSSDLVVKVRINTLRSGATHQYQKNGYNRPKYLTTPYFELKKGKSVSFTSPYGGTLQLSFNKNELPVAVTFNNIGEHAYWGSEADNASFAQKLAAKEYDWAEVATAGFEVHSKLDKMIQSVEDDRWGRTAEGLAAAIKKYTSNYPHVLAGFKGEGVDVVAEIHDWATAKNLTIETIDQMKHMNADQATCGYGCSGNPYDAYWSFNPIGHGDIHELGHSLQKKRFEGFPNHAATNTFSYYTKSQYFAHTGGNNDCGGQPFKSLFDTIQASAKAAQDQSLNQDALNAYLKTNLWDKAGLGEQYLLKIQAMMHAQKMGKVENGWHVLARVHILEREKGRAIKDWDAKKEDIGFSTYTLDEFKAIRDNDWLVVSYSYAATLDYRNYFDMMGIPYSQKARDQIASFGFEVVPNALFASTDKGYCSSDVYGSLFDRQTVLIDGKATYPDGSQDTTPPVITLNGNNPLSLQNNTSYTEQGATATDVLDGHVNVTIAGTVDPLIAGRYTIIYTATDKAGNKTSTTRTVIVLAPALRRSDTLTFLGNATFSSKESDILFIKEKGYEQWIDAQLVLPNTPNQHLKRTITLAKKLEPNLAPHTINEYLADNETVFNKTASFHSVRYQMSAWFETALFSEDQLRQRVAYALSQIIVESLAEPIFTRRGEALAHYFDILTKNALGNYRDLLIDISHSASMGLYLTYNGSKKKYASGNTIIYPDENYAREIMQLFTIGLKELNLDGTDKLDASGNPIPTYNQLDVNALARIFTGWDLKKNNKFGRIAFMQGDFTQPLEFTSEYHDDEEKKVLGQTISAGNTGTQDIAAAIDILMNHSNIAPFISKQLIMRLAHSNPTPSYIERVATVFNDNGQGVKGDLKAVVKAIFLDPEHVQNNDKKKYKEPLIAYMQFLNAFKIKPFPRWRLSGGEEVENALLINDPSSYLGQGAARAATVFNFYSNDYIPNNSAFVNANLVAPEVQIQTDSVIISFNNKIHDNLLRLEKRYLIQKNGSLSIRSQNIGADRFLLDCTAEYEVIEKALEGSVNGVFESFNSVSRVNDVTDAEGLTARDRALNALILHLDNKLTGGGLSPEQKKTLFEGYKDVFYERKIGRAENPEMEIMKTIITPIIAIIVTSEVNMVQ